MKEKILEILEKIRHLRHEGGQTRYALELLDCPADERWEVMNRWVPSFFNDVSKHQLYIIPSEVAQAVLEKLLHLDMAYGSKIMPLHTAKFWSAYLFEHLGPEAHYFSNSRWQDEAGFLKFDSWNPMTEATYDSGLVFYNNEYYGTIWFEDED